MRDSAWTWSRWRTVRGSRAGSRKERSRVLFNAVLLPSAPRLSPGFAPAPGARFVGGVHSYLPGVLLFRENCAARSRCAVKTATQVCQAPLERNAAAAFGPHKHMSREQDR